MNSSGRAVCFAVTPYLLSLCPAWSQVPAILLGGIVNAASGASPAAPGGIISIYGTSLASAQQSASGVPLPLTLAGSSVSIGGIPAPLYYVSPGQINAQVPSSIHVSPSPLSDSQLTVDSAQVVVTTSAGSSPGMAVALTYGSPGLFSIDQSGCGQAAALNIRPDGSVSINSPMNSAAPGDYISLFGTDFGVSSEQPPDGAASAVPAPLETSPQLFLDGAPVSSVSYAGLAPSLVGVDQINFEIPADTRNACALPVSALGVFGGPALTISVNSGRGQCSDPPSKSWGQILFTKTLISEPGPLLPPPSSETFTASSETFTASFPSGPKAEPAGQEPVVFAPDYAIPQLTGQLIRIVGPVPINFRSCAIPGSAYLSAGNIQIQSPQGQAATVTPRAVASGGLSYVQVLPSGFIVPGTYSIIGTAGSEVELNTNVSIGSPIELASAFPPGTAISNSQPLTIKWTGGDANSLVRVAINAFPAVGTGAPGIYSYAPASSGSMTINPRCDAPGGVCSFGLSSAAGGIQLQVQVVPDPAHLTLATVPGITGPVQLKWSYTWNFVGISLAP